MPRSSPERNPVAAKIPQYELTAIEVAVLEAVRRCNNSNMPANELAIRSITSHSSEEVAEALTSLIEKRFIWVRPETSREHLDGGVCSVSEMPPATPPEKSPAHIA